MLINFVYFCNVCLFTFGASIHFFAWNFVSFYLIFFAVLFMFLVWLSYTILQNERMWWREAPPPPPPPHQTLLNWKTNQDKLCIILKRIYMRFRISLNNCEFTKFRDFTSDFASWSQKSRLGEIGQNFKVFLSIKYYEIRINQIIS